MRRATCVLLALAACASNEPVEVPPHEIPFPLTRIEATESPEVKLLRFDVTFVRRGSGRLVSVQRSERSSLPREEVVIRSLLAGPTAREEDRNIVSAVPAATRLLRIAIFTGGVAEVDLSREFQSAAASRAFLQRVAQVVLTLSGVRGITAVRFSIDGEVVSVPTDRGQTVNRPVTAADYASLTRARR